MNRKLDSGEFEHLSIFLAAFVFLIYIYAQSLNNYAILIEIIVYIFLVLVFIGVLKKTDIRYSWIISAFGVIVIICIIGFISQMQIIKEMKIKAYIENVSKIVENNNLDYRIYKLKDDGIYNDSIHYNSDRVYILPKIIDIDSAYVDVQEDSYYIKIETFDMCAIKDFNGNLSIIKGQCSD